MPTTITRLMLGSGLLGVNAYLIETHLGFVLVDTGTHGKRAELERRLEAAGCAPGTVKLIFITHGDFDHIGSAAYLRRRFDAPVAMHEGDAAMAAQADMFAGRKQPGFIARALLPLFARLRSEDRFEPDVILTEDSDLTEYGLAGARILLLQGHSAGSVGLLLSDGSLFVGDVLENRSSPKLGSIMDDVPKAQASVQRLRTLHVSTVYPGHGAPFSMSDVAQV